MRLPGHHRAGGLHRLPLAIGASVALLLVAIVFVVTRLDGDPPRTTPPAVASPVAAVPTLAVLTRAAIPAASPAAPITCESGCLIRMVDDARTRDALEARGLRAAYAYGGQLWTMAPARSVDRLRAESGAVTVVADSAETLRLYVLRTPEGTDEAIVRETGDILDHAGNQYIVRVPSVPPPVLALAEAGIWIEKLPPAPVERLRLSDSRPPLDDLADISGAIAQEELRSTILELQASSSSDGTGVGTRYYASTGNVMAGEYLFQRLDAYGVRVWYEEFITEDGLLALNVVAELPGQDPSAVYVVLCHYDTISDSIGAAPGADDNASGVAGTLEIARVLSGYTLRHPVRFFFTNVEEVNLQGVKAFAARANEEGTPIEGAFNLDAIGSAQHGSQLVLNGDEASIRLEELLIELNDAYGLGQDLLVRQNPIIVADDNFMREAGFPTILVARELFGWSSIVHTPGDVIETVDLENVQSATQLILLGVGALVQIPVDA